MRGKAGAFGLLLVAFLISIGGLRALIEWGKWRHPGGSQFPAGMSLGIVAVSASLVLIWIAVRRRPGFVTLLVAAPAVIFNVFCLYYIIAGMLFALLGIGP